MKSVRECLKSIRPAQPPEGPGGPPPATEGPGGPPPPPGGPPPPPSATEVPEDEESGDNDLADVETVEDVDAQTAATSGQLRHRPGGKSCKGTSLPITAINTHILHKDSRLTVIAWFQR